MNLRTANKLILSFFIAQKAVKTKSFQVQTIEMIRLGKKLPFLSLMLYF